MVDVEVIIHVEVVVDVEVVAVSVRCSTSYALYVVQHQLCTV